MTGEPAQTAVLIRLGEVKILSQFDTYYTQIENDMAILNDRNESWRLDKPEVEQWGSVDVGAFQVYFD